MSGRVRWKWATSIGFWRWKWANSIQRVTGRGARLSAKRQVEVGNFYRDSEMAVGDFYLESLGSRSAPIREAADRSGTLLYGYFIAPYLKGAVEVKWRDLLCVRGAKNRICGNPVEVRRSWRSPVNGWLGMTGSCGSRGLEWLVEGGMTEVERDGQGQPDS